MTQKEKTKLLELENEILKLKIELSELKARPVHYYYPQPWYPHPWYQQPFTYTAGGTTVLTTANADVSSYQYLVQ